MGVNIFFTKERQGRFDGFSFSVMHGTTEPGALVKSARLRFQIWLMPCQKYLIKRLPWLSTISIYVAHAVQKGGAPMQSSAAYLPEL